MFEQKGKKTHLTIEGHESHKIILLVKSIVFLLRLYLSGRGNTMDGYKWWRPSTDLMSLLVTRTKRYIKRWILFGHDSYFVYIGVYCRRRVLHLQKKSKGRGRDMTKTYLRSTCICVYLWEEDDMNMAFELVKKLIACKLVLPWPSQRVGP